MKMLIIILILLIPLSNLLAAQDKPYFVEERKTFKSWEKPQNFGVIYAAQWVYYALDQRQIIEEHGSFKNWISDPIRPHFDNDSFDYNIFKHSLAGSFYYQWYRTRGYEEKEAFFWSAMSSLAFEFTIETITERPSFQDIYQTPVFGTVLGMGLERASIFFHTMDTWYGHTLGYIFNPFTLIPRPKSTDEVVFLKPIINKDVRGFAVTYQY